MALQRKHAKPGQRIENDLQTNGTLLDEDWARFLKEHSFLVGLSIDGPRDVHDHCRVTRKGEPTFDRVCDAATILRRHGVRYNTLTCVSRYNASKPLDVYRFLRRELGSTYLQFIPIVEPREFEGTAPQRWDLERMVALGDPRTSPDHPESVVTPWTVDAEEYGYFLSKVWDEWLARDYGKVLVNFCETLVAQHMGLPSQICVHSEFCGKGVALEHDGSAYACDHYVYPEYRLGNVRERSLGDMVFSPEQVRFGYVEVGKPAGVLPAVRVPFGLLGRVPEEPVPQDAGWRAGAELPLRGFEALLRACDAGGRQAGPQAEQAEVALPAASGDDLDYRALPGMTGPFVDLAFDFHGVHEFQARQFLPQRRQCRQQVQVLRAAGPVGELRGCVGLEQEHATDLQARHDLPVNRGAQSAGQVAPDRHDTVPAVRFDLVDGEVGDQGIEVYALGRRQLHRLAEPDRRLVHRKWAKALLGQEDRIASFSLGQAQHVAATADFSAVRAQEVVRLGSVEVVRRAVSLVPGNHHCTLLTAFRQNYAADSGKGKGRQRRPFRVVSKGRVFPVAQPAQFAVETALFAAEGGFLHALFELFDVVRRHLRPVDLDRQLVELAVSGNGGL